MNSDKLVIIDHQSGTVAIYTNVLRPSEIEKAIEHHCVRLKVKRENLKWLHFSRPIVIE